MPAHRSGQIERDGGSTQKVKNPCFREIPCPSSGGVRAPNGAASTKLLRMGVWIGVESNWSDNKTVSQISGILSGPLGLVGVGAGSGIYSCIFQTSPVTTAVDGPVGNWRQRGSKQRFREPEDQHGKALPAVGAGRRALWPPLATRGNHIV